MQWVMMKDSFLFTSLSIHGLLLHEQSKISQYFWLVMWYSLHISQRFQLWSSLRLGAALWLLVYCFNHAASVHSKQFYWSNKVILKSYWQFAQNPSVCNIYLLRQSQEMLLVLCPGTGDGFRYCTLIHLRSTKQALWKTSSFLYLLSGIKFLSCFYELKKNKNIYQSWYWKFSCEQYFCLK